MQIRYIDYKITDNGFQELSRERIRQTEHNIHRLRIYADFEATGTSPLKVMLSLERADRLEIRPVAMTLAQDDNGVWHRFYDIKETMTEITGPLRFSVSYEIWGVNEQGVIVLEQRYPEFVHWLYVYDANGNVYSRNWDIYQRLADLEGVNTGGFTVIINEIKDRLNELETGAGGEGVIKLETLEEANASPKAQKAGSIAFIKI